MIKTKTKAEVLFQSRPRSGEERKMQRAIEQREVFLVGCKNKKKQKTRKRDVKKKTTEDEEIDEGKDGKIRRGFSKADAFTPKQQHTS